MHTVHRSSLFRNVTFSSSSHKTALLVALIDLCFCFSSRLLLSFMARFLFLSPPKSFVYMKVSEELCTFFTATFAFAFFGQSVFLISMGSLAIHVILYRCQFICLTFSFFFSAFANLQQLQRLRESNELFFLSCRTCHYLYVFALRT